MEGRMIAQLTRANPMQNCQYEHRILGLDFVFSGEPVQRTEQLYDLLIPISISDQVGCCILYQIKLSWAVWLHSQI